MRKEDFELVAEKMREVAEIIKLFPEELQEKVYDHLVLTLLDPPSPNINANQEPTLEVSNGKVSQPAQLNDASSNSLSYIIEFKSFVKEKDPSNRLNHQEFATLATYYFMNKAPIEQRITEMSEEKLSEAYKLAERKPPVSVVQALRDAKSKLKSLDKGSKTGCYKINSMGEYFVQHELPMKKAEK